MRSRRPVSPDASSPCSASVTYRFSWRASSRAASRAASSTSTTTSIGGRAYGALARSHERRRRLEPARVFAELAAKFQPLVDALGEIADAAYVFSQRDILRLYEIWLKTESARARRLLRRLGVEPAPVATRPH